MNQSPAYPAPAVMKGRASFAPVPLLWPAVAMLLGACTINDPNVDIGEHVTAGPPVTQYDGIYDGSTSPIGTPDPRCSAGVRNVTVHVADGTVRVSHRHGKHTMTGQITADGRFIIHDGSGERTLSGTISGRSLVGSETSDGGAMYRKAAITCAYSVGALKR